jgi:hypothetical protein
MDSKFKVGDKIKAPSSDRMGWHFATIQKIEALAKNNFDVVYWVEWYHYPDKTFDYRAADVEDLWELADPCPVVNMTITLPRSIDFVPIELTIEDIKVAGCDHKWIDYHGFLENYQFCAKCDEKRKYE